MAHFTTVPEFRNKILRFVTKSGKIDFGGRCSVRFGVRSRRFYVAKQRYTKGASDPVENLIVDLAEWVAAKDLSYSEVMDAWRAACPRLPVWEEANDRDL